jgi:hypothetical protein
VHQLGHDGPAGQRGAAIGPLVPCLTKGAHLAAGGSARLSCVSSVDLTAVAAFTAAGLSLVNVAISAHGAHDLSLAACK